MTLFCRVVVVVQYNSSNNYEDTVHKMPSVRMSVTMSVKLGEHRLVQMSVPQKTIPMEIPMSVMLEQMSEFLQLLLRKKLLVPVFLLTSLHQKCLQL